MPTAPDHIAAAMEHLALAAEVGAVGTGIPMQRYHLSVAATQATLASVAAAQGQAEAAREAARINTRLLDFLAQGPPAPTADPDAPAGVAR